MKNAMLLVGIWLGIILVAYSVAFVHEDVPRGALALADRTFVSPSGFELPVPAGWSLVETAYGARLIAPIASIEVWIVPVVAEDAETAFTAAWMPVDPCPGCARPAVLTFDVSSPSEEASRATLIYASDGSGRQLRGEAVGAPPNWVVLWVRQAVGSMPQRVAADLQRVEAGLAYDAPEPVVTDVPAEETSI